MVSACSGTVAAGNTSTPSASITQTAPSVWSAPDTTPASTAGAAGGTSAGAAGSTDSTLPGLSAACSAAIRAQSAVTDLFAAALKGSAAPVSGTAAAPTAAPSTKSTVTGRTTAPTGGSSAAPPAASPVPTAASPASTAPSAGAEKPSGITQADVTKTFDEIAKHLPGALATPFRVLRDAANRIAGKSAHDVPDVLSDAQVSNALKAIADYITACQPPTTD